ncbi:LPXTG cell wall anchor domain-containing protein [Faecalicatena sp. AGMB00832]|uniref:LPXTG cell wall anchor domain-containing protein n=1 Tax=Faecalicatena faecalis TaxID=2726362 RepID=A0ABS6D9J5_9FIRM|nr:LPXTG cell wall anchor domain-containing protein [Faecalicatena faecalis]MBU3878129.1 LPXTG cell wall anchor domain-containing protein [Faecalicatena faecalis]
MKRKSRRGLALMLAFILTGAACMMPDVKVSAASAAGTENRQTNNLEVVDKTAQSITLRAQDNYEYAIETTVNNTKSWKWADASQYDKTNKTVTFTGLNAEQTYQFASRLAGTTDVLGQVSVKTKAQENTPAVQTTPNTPDVSSDTQTPQQPPEVTTDNNQITDENDKNVLDQTLTGDNPDQQGNVKDTTKDTSKDAIVQGGTEQENKTTTDLTTENKNTQTDPPKTENSQNQIKADSITAPQAAKLSKPDAPVVSDDVTDQKITLELPKSADTKYVYEYSMDGKDFQSSPVFDHLKPDTEYQFCMRIAAGTYEGIVYSDPSDNSDSTAKVRTKKAAPEQPKYAPELAKRTDTSITLKAADDEKNPDALEFGMVTSQAAVQWQKTGVFENLTPGMAYEFVVRYGVDEKVQMPGTASEAFKTSTLEKAAQAPAAPALENRTDTSITLKAANGQQYAMVKADGSVDWQDNPQFTGLKPNTVYQFVARMKYDPEKAMESIRSEAAGFKTVISFEGSKITGIKAGGSYEEGSKLTAVAVGTGMENASPAAGDTRWVPKSWSWDGENWKDWDNAPYSITATYSQPGNYNLRVNFQLQEYTQNGWKALNDSKSTNVKFKITEKKVFYTIQAEAGANGKINPSGKVEVQKGKDYEFTFTPNKGYRTAKVTVDGKEVTFKNNKYTFTNVQGAHKISVTFEKDKRTPKTGDMSQPAIFLGLLLISGMLILGLAYKKRKS